MAERRPLGFGRHDEQAPSADGATPAIPTMDDKAAAALLPERPKRGHKGTFGKVLVIAGSLDYAGAALLVCRAAGRAGAGLVTLAVPESLQPLFAAKVVEATTMALPEDDVEEVDPEPAIARILDHDHDAIVLGPGLRPGLATTDLVRLLLVAPDDGPAPMVLDAEALRSMATLGEWWKGDLRPCVLTPHSGEFARLRAGAGVEPEADGDLSDDDEARQAAAKAAAVTWQQVVVLKGAKTVIAEPDGTVTVAPFENPALASGGTGDVLSGDRSGPPRPGRGSRAGGEAGRLPPRTAGETVRERLGDAGLLASDLPDVLPGVRKRLAAIAERGKPGKRLGFTVRDGDGARARPAAPPRRRSRSASRRPGCRRSHEPPGRRSTLGRWPATSRSSGSWPVQGVPVHPVVKADAYGHGAIPVARALEAAGADGFCVATLDEGLALRQAGVVRPILVLYPIPPQLSVEARDAGIAVTAGDPSCSAALLGALDAARRPGSTSTSSSRPAWVVAGSTAAAWSRPPGRSPRPGSLGWPACGRTSRHPRTSHERPPGRGIHVARA